MMDEKSRNASNEAREKLLAATIEAVATLRASLSDKSAATRITAAVAILQLGTSTEIRAIESRVTVLERKKAIVSTQSAEPKEAESSTSAKAAEINRGVVAPSLKPLEHRIRRLEEEVDGGQCDGCNQLFYCRILIRGEGTVTEPDGTSYCVEPDWSTTDLACCPLCGATEPTMSIDYFRNHDTLGEFIANHKASIDLLVRENRARARKLMDEASERDASLQDIIYPGLKMK